MGASKDPKALQLAVSQLESAKKSKDEPVVANEIIEAKPEPKRSIRRRSDSRRMQDGRRTSRERRNIRNKERRERMERNRFERRKRNSRRDRPQRGIGTDRPQRGIRRDRPQRGIGRDRISNRRGINTTGNMAPNSSRVNVGKFNELLNRLSNFKRKR